MKKILIFRLKIHWLIMQILCTLLSLFNIIINFGNSDVYAYKDYESGGFDAISVSELACAILPGLVVIYEALFVIGLTVIVLKLNKDMPYKQFWFNAPFDKEHLFTKNRKHTYALIILFTASVICSIIIRALLRKPIFTPCCWAPASGFIFTIYFNTMLGNICAYLKQKG